MKDDTMSVIGQSLFNFQAALKESGSSFEEYLDKYYYNKWVGDTLYAAMALRTTFVTAMHQFLANEGLFDRGLKFRSMTLPDTFIDQASPEAMYAMAGLNTPDIEAKVLSALGVTDLSSKRA